MLILVGLGNPGEKHARHRHNVGFMAVDAIADKHGFSAPREKFQGVVRDGAFDTSVGRVKAMTLKPLTYMNESGRSVREAAAFYKVAPENVIVFYDELDLAPGKVKIKTGGGAAGHNGIRSIDAHVGNQFQRVRIGIGHPGHKSKVTGHVLGNFAKADEIWLPDLLEAMAASAPWLASDGPRFLTELALTLNPADTPKKRPVQKKTQAPTPATPPTTANPSPRPAGSENEKTQSALGDALSKIFGKNAHSKDQS